MILKHIFLESCIDIWIKLYLTQFHILIISLVMVSIELEESLTIGVQSCPYLSYSKQLGHYALNYMAALFIAFLFSFSEMGFRGDRVSLVCPLSYIDSIIWFSQWNSSSNTGNTENKIASYIGNPAYELKRLEPWEGRGWTIDTSNGNLIIPEVLLSDEDLYYCVLRPGAPDPSLVKLAVYGKILSQLFLFSLK